MRAEALSDRPRQTARTTTKRTTAKRITAKRTTAKREPSAKRELKPLVFGEYMNTIESASYLRLSKQFLEGARYRGDGSGPAYMKLGRVVRYRKSALDAWMKKNEHAADKPSQ